MVDSILRRISYALITLFFVSIVSFIIIQLPPGDFADSYAARRHTAGEIITEEEVEGLRLRLGLNKPMYVQYGNWVWGIMQGDLGMSLEYKRPVAELIGERLPLTLLLAFATLVFIYAVALTIGIYSAVRQYSIGDHIFTVIGYIGLATPNFLLALILMYMGHKWFGQNVGGLFSPEFMDATWSWARLKDMLAHLWVPVVVLGTAGTAFQIRTMRAVLLDELNKMYVVSARATGLSEFNTNEISGSNCLKSNYKYTWLGTHARYFRSTYCGCCIGPSGYRATFFKSAFGPRYISSRRYDSNILCFGNNRHFYI